MYYIHPIPDATLDVIETIENDIFWLDELARLTKVCIGDPEILKN